MRLIGAASLVFVLALTHALSNTAPVTYAHDRGSNSGPNRGSGHDDRDRHGKDRFDGKEIFRFDTFGDEQLWTDVLQMNDVVETVPPAVALQVGLKVDVQALPEAIIAALRNNEVNLNDPAVTVELVRLNAVVGIKGDVQDGQITRLGITCALCHSTVDDSFAPGIGKRLDGWAATDLNVGAIVALSPALPQALKDEFNTWGPGMYDPRHHYFDGTSINLLNTASLPVVIPPIYGLKGVGFETYTADGPIAYWNGYVGIGQMGGQGTFKDPRINLFIKQRPDLVTPKLPALLEYQLSLRTPKAPKGSFDREAARRGRRIFRNDAGCATCHQGSKFTDVNRGHGRRPFLHEPAAVGQEAEYARRSATNKYRTTPLRALWQHAPYFHDGSAPDLLAVVNHYDELFGLNLTDQQKADLVEYLKSI
jgi:mono/diheme cytochrome c family protein